MISASQAAKSSDNTSRGPSVGSPGVEGAELAEPLVGVWNSYPAFVRGGVDGIGRVGIAPDGMD